MITEDYVSFEVAVLLKEKGFDEECYQKYDGEGYLSFNHVGYINAEKSNEDFSALAPTHQMAMKWLRENYDLHIIVFPYKRGTSAKGWCCQVFLTYNLLGYDKYTNETCNSYEDAVEAALKYSLENLILRKN